MRSHGIASLTLASVVVGVAAVAVSAVGCSSGPEGDTRPWVLVWSDDFDGAKLDDSKWTVQTGASFGTSQLDFDTERPENIAVTGGNLVVTARKEAYSGKQYTSGRLETVGKFERTYGKFEVRLKMPHGQGMWPAFWLLGTDYTTASWPACGEIDVMENRGAELSTIHGSLHGPGYSGGAAFTEAYTLAGGAAFTDDFHTFGIEWEPGVLRWYVDGQLYQTRSSDTLSRSKTWVFDDKSFFMILDLAVGGIYGGDPDGATPFPQEMLVDYVHVYSRGGV